MRNPDRLDGFYLELKEIHKRSFPDWRFGQFMMNALGWIGQYQIDPFFPEEDKILNYFKMYSNAQSPMFRGWEVKGER